jgi:probable addiction module antidote protein
MSNAKNEMPAGAALAPFEPSEYLRTPEEIAAFLEAAFADYDGDSRVIVKALGTAAKARGMSKIAEASGISREGLYQALSGKGNPSFDTVLKVMRALNVAMKPTTSAPVEPEALIFEGQIFQRVKLGAAYGWTGEEIDAFVAEPFPYKKAVHRQKVRITQATRKVLPARSKRTTGKSATR